ncbi:hypothetical protein [Pseudophaeobacter sp.]|uniref:hypothetical protein n=1 Tax=Pseudophaeobacter sp. TaxID=1971739 RepID=UPI00329A699A
MAEKQSLPFYVALFFHGVMHGAWPFFLRRPAEMFLRFVLVVLGDLGTVKVSFFNTQSRATQSKKEEKEHRKMGV